MIDDPGTVRQIVFNYVLSWLSSRTTVPVDQIDVDLTLSDPPPDGYNVTVFGKLCSDCEKNLSVSTGHALQLNGAWRKAHKGDTVAAFIEAVSQAVLNAPHTAVAPLSRAWAEGRA